MEYVNVKRLVMPINPIKIRVSKESLDKISSSKRYVMGSSYYVIKKNKIYSCRKY